PPRPPLLPYTTLFRSPNAAERDLPRILRGEGGLPVDTIPFLAKQTRVTFANFGYTRPLSLEDYQNRGGFKGLEEAASLTPQEIRSEEHTSELQSRSDL